MKQDKELLLKDLCGRLPYNVKCAILSEKQPFTLTTIEVDYINGHLFNFLELRRGFFVQVYTSELKPYLFPLSSMTEEQIAQIDFLAFMKEYHKITDFYYKNHIDFRGLIEKKLAIDCTNLNIY